MIAREKLYTAPGQRRLVGPVASADTKVFLWSWDIPAGKALVLKKFSCPSDFPRLAKGEHFLPYRGPAASSTRP